MGTELIEGVFFEPLDTIHTTGGSVMHAIRRLDSGLPEFGECYFSTAQSFNPKAWKKHRRMICNLFVPVGAVKFVFFDDRTDSKDRGEIREIVLSAQNYGRLIIHPGIWFGFCGVAEQMDSLVLNVANIPHDPAEGIRLEPDSDQIPYKWRF